MKTVFLVAALAFLVWITATRPVPGPEWLLMQSGSTIRTPSLVRIKKSKTILTIRLFDKSPNKHHHQKKGAA
jgi:hypothetical protein